MKIKLVMINNRLNIVEEKICKLEDISNRNHQKLNMEEMQEGRK